MRQAGGPWQLSALLYFLRSSFFSSFSNSYNNKRISEFDRGWVIACDDDDLARIALSLSTVTWVTPPPPPPPRERKDNLLFY